APCFRLRALNCELAELHLSEVALHGLLDEGLLVALARGCERHGERRCGDESESLCVIRMCRQLGSAFHHGDSLYMCGSRHTVRPTTRRASWAAATRSHSRDGDGGLRGRPRRLAAKPSRNRNRREAASRCPLCE